MTILCIASYEKGHEFLRECKRQGARTLLLTSLSLKDENAFPREALDDIFYMPDVEKKWNIVDTIKAVSHLARTEQIDRLVPLDDFDLELAATLREHLRIPGMGETTTRYFRDKLANRMKAAEAGIPVPQFVHVLNHARVNEFMDRVPPPWVLKPRLMAGAIGIKKVHSREQFWDIANGLGDEQSYYVLEQFIPGDVLHVDSIVYEREVRFAIASKYGKPPMQVSHEGDVFTTAILERGTPLESSLLELNGRVLAGLGLIRGVSHTEYIRAHDGGQLYFLETAARVGGAHIADLVEAASGLNLWAEWAKIELAGGKAPYTVAPSRCEYAALLVTLAKQEWPDTRHYADPEICWRIDKKHHVGFIVKSPGLDRVNQLLAQYLDRVRRDFWAYLPPKERPSD
ncbi:MAG: ATPase [Bryobacteraceae bacterium]|nr:ATPase [Bryobacteraceae bacterium]